MSLVILSVYQRNREWTAELLKTRRENVSTGENRTQRTKIVRAMLIQRTSDIEVDQSSENRAQNG